MKTPKVPVWLLLVGCILLGVAVVWVLGIFRKGLFEGSALWALPISVTLFSVMATFLAGEAFSQLRTLSRLRRLERSSEPGPPCRTLRSICDWIPGPRLRKRVQKMLADQEAHIDALTQARRTKAAWWIHVWTWLLVGVMIFKAPVAALRETFSRRRSG